MTTVEQGPAASRRDGEPDDRVEFDPPPLQAARGAQALVRALWFGLGVVSVALAMLGIVLPLLPTTPFLLLAAYAFGRSSDRWRRWLLEHPTFGPPIADWRRSGAISRRAKGAAVLTMLAAVGFSLVLQVPLWVLALQGVAFVGVCLFILTRPEPPPERAPPPL